MFFKDLVDESFDNGTKPFEKAIIAVKTIAKGGIDEKTTTKEIQNRTR